MLHYALIPEFHREWEVPLFEFLRRENPSVGTVKFRGNLHPRAEEFDFLRNQGVELKPAKPPDFAHWALTARHPQWGDAVVVCPKELPPLSTFLAFASNIPEDLRAAAQASTIGVSVKIPAKTKSVLKDRKNLLQYLRALMHDDGLVAIDHQSTMAWMAECLDCELMHDADLDVSSLYMIHAITEDGDTDEPSITWMHTHGLGEVGAFDVDILSPDRSWASEDVIRSIAFSVLEQSLTPDTKEYPVTMDGPFIRLVSAQDFMASAPAAERALREDPDGHHTKNRYVLCEPEGKRLLSFGKSVRAAAGFKKPMPERGLFPFSNASTELMAERARVTAHLIPAIIDELRDFEPQVAAKLGYPTDSEGEDQREHLWFDVHSIDGDTMDATLMNTPFDIKSMHEGDRGIRPISRLTDWTIGLPFGTISPRQFNTLTMARANREVLLEMMRRYKSESGNR